jgi:hypothetical protein
VQALKEHGKNIDMKGVLDPVYVTKKAQKSGRVLGVSAV